VTGKVQLRRLLWSKDQLLRIQEIGVLREENLLRLREELQLRPERQLQDRKEQKDKDQLLKEKHLQEENLLLHQDLMKVADQDQMIVILHHPDLQAAHLAQVLPDQETAAAADVLLQEEVDEVDK